MKKKYLFNVVKFIAISFSAYFALIQAVFSRQNSDSDATDLDALKADIRPLRVLPNQSHAMIDMVYHFANLWFAGKVRIGH